MRETLKIILAIAASKEWPINAVDIKAAFLLGKKIDRQAVAYLRSSKGGGAGADKPEH